MLILSYHAYIYQTQLEVILCFDVNTLILCVNTALMLILSLKCLNKAN